MEALLGFLLVAVGAIVIRANTAPDYVFIPLDDPYWKPEGSDGK